MHFSIFSAFSLILSVIINYHINWGIITMLNIKISGISRVKPSDKITFDTHTRWRVQDGTTQLDLATQACRLVLEQTNIPIESIDCIVSASAAYLQPIPCNAALIHEQIAKGLAIPCVDVNTTCTSFISALDLFSYAIAAGRYKNVLIVASDLPSLGLNPKQEESYKLFSDGASAAIITLSDGTSSIIAAKQATWSEGAHDTEIRGGGTLQSAFTYTPEQKEDYMFDMNGYNVLRLVNQKAIPFIKDFLTENNLSLSDIDKIVPHQASVALNFMMRKLGASKEQYVDIIEDVGNMVSASVPYTLSHAIAHKLIKRGDTILLIGTAAGLTVNALVLKY